MSVARDPAGEAGQALIEVLAAAILLIAIALSTFVVLQASDSVAGTTSARAGAVSLLSSEQQRLRSLSAVQSLTDYDSTRTVALPTGAPGGSTRTYTVSSQVTAARDAGGDVSCTADTSDGDYLHSTVRVSWDGLTPLRAESLISPSPGSESRDLGMLVVQVVDRANAPVGDATVTAAGRSQVTNSDGCAVFNYVPAGTYTARASAPTTVAPDGTATPSQSATVIGGQTALSKFALDAPAELPLTFSTATQAGVAVASPAAAPSSVSLTNTDSRFNGTTTSGAPKPRVLPWTGTTRSLTGLFPFTTTTSAYAGGCAGNDPANNAVASSSWSTSTLQSGLNPTLTVRVPTVALQLSGPATVNGLVAKLTPDTSVTTMSGCTDSFAMPAAATSSGRAGVTSLAVPYGNYVACAASGTWKAGGIKVANTSPSGTALVAVRMTNVGGTQTCP